MVCGLEDASIEIDDRLSLKGNLPLNLRGVIYFKDYHFTARVWDANGNVWFHDGQTTGAACEKELNGNLLTGIYRSTCRGANAVQAVYA